MTTVYSAALATILAGATSKLDWASKLQAALGNTPRLRMIRDADASAANPETTGVEFRNVALVGPFVTRGGNIVSWGKTSGTTVRAAVNLLTGKSVVVITGNGHSVIQSLGLTRAAQTAFGVASGDLKDYDYTLSEQPTATSGVGFSEGSGIKAPALLPSGVGSAAPAKVATSPHRVRIWDYTNASTPVLAGVLELSQRTQDWTFQDQEQALSMGDSAVYRSPADTTWGEFLAGATMTISGAPCTEAGVRPLYQVLVAFAHTYPGYPDIANYNKVTTHLTLPPFKAVLHDGNDAPMYTWEMPDGRAVNDPTLLSSSERATAAATQAQPMHPKLNCRQGLFWESEKPSVTTQAKKFFPGVASDFRPSMSKMQYSLATTEPIITGPDGGNQRNTLGNYFYAPRFPLPRAPHTLTDSYLATDINNPGSTSYAGGFVMGWDYTVGGYGLHNWYTGPGGQRVDRCIVPAPFAAFLTDPTGVRLQENTPWRDMADGFRKSYFNHSNLLVSSPSKLYLDTNANLLDGTTWSAVGNYYGDYPYSGKAFMMNGNTSNNYDDQGNYVINGWCRDGNHCYSQRGMGALFFNSPMHAIGSKFDSFTAAVIYRSPSRDDAGNYQVRSQAWDWLNHVVGWKLGSTHELGITQEEWALRFDKLLASIYQNVYVPTFVNNSQSVRSRGLRDLGINCQINDGLVYTPGGRLGLYMAFLMPLMKQTGFWSAMRARNSMNAIVLDNLVRNWDKFCFDNILDCDGGTGFGDKYWVGRETELQNMITSWTVYGQQKDIEPGAFMTDASGNFRSDPDSSIHNMIQYIRMRSMYFPEYPHARLAAAQAKIATYENQALAAVTAASTPLAKTQADYYFRHHGIAPQAAPTVLGPQ